MCHCFILNLIKFVSPLKNYTLLDIQLDGCQHFHKLLESMNEKIKITGNRKSGNITFKT